MIRPVSQVRWFVLAAFCLATVIAYVDRFCIGVPVGAIMDEVHLDEDQMADVLMAFFLTYALFQIPTGWLGQVWGTRRALPVFTILWSLATGLSALATSYWELVFSRLAMGAAEAGIFPCATSSLARWFPSTRRAWVSGVLASFMGLGGALGMALTSSMMYLDIHWRMIFLLYAIPGILWAGWFFFWFRDRPEEHPSVTPGELDLIRERPPEPPDDPGPESGPSSPAIRPAAAAIASRELAPRLLSEEKRDEDAAAVARPPATGPTPWLAILTSTAMLWIAAQQFFRAAGYVFYASWFPTFLTESRGVTPEQAGLLGSLPLVAQVVGSLTGGMISDWILVRTGSRRLARQGLAVISQVGCALLVIATFFVADAVLAVLVIAAGSFVASLAGPTAYALTIDMGGRHVAAVFSVMNMSGNLGAVAFPKVVPWLKDLAGSWDLVLYVFAAVYVAAAICWIPFNPTKPIVSMED